MKVKNIMFFGFAAAILSAGAANAASTAAYDALTRTTGANDSKIVTSKQYVDASTNALKADINDIDIPDVSDLNSKKHTHADGTNTTAVTQDGVVTINVPGVSSVDGAATTAIPTVGALTSYVGTATNDMATQTWVGQQNYLTQHQDISGKQDKIEDATAGDITTTDANGQTQDSGKSFDTTTLSNSADKVPVSSVVTSAISTATNDMATQTWVGQQNYLTQHQDISGKQDKIEDATAGDITTTDANGQTQDSGKSFDTTTLSNSADKVPVSSVVTSAISTATNDMATQTWVSTQITNNSVNQIQSGSTPNTISVDGTDVAVTGYAVDSSCTAGTPCALVDVNGTKTWLGMAI